MPVSQNCQTVVVKSDKCCYKTTVITVDGVEDINNVLFPENPNAYDHHIVQFDDSIVIYEFYGGSWSVVARTSRTIDSEFTLTAFLRGPYSGGTMTTTLATNSLIPLTEPYEGLGYERVHFSGETVADLSVFTTNTITDWILVELRDKNNPEVIKYNKAALLKNNGAILEVDGVTPVTFEGITQDSYYVSIRHRNHMGVMTAEPAEVTDAGVTIDFSDPGTQLWGTDAAYNNAGVINLYAGKHSIRYGKYRGWNSGYNSILKELSYNTAGQLNDVYNQFDFNLDGKLRFTTGVPFPPPIVTGDAISLLSYFLTIASLSGKTTDELFYVERVPFWDRSEFEKTLAFSYKYDYFWSGTSGIKLPTGLDTDRPVSPELGTVRQSSTSNKLEYYNGTSWVTIGAEPTYKVYRAFVTQSGTSAPTAVIVENTLGAVPVWSYNDIGDFTLTLTGSFTLNKTSIDLRFQNEITRIETNSHGAWEHYDINFIKFYSMSGGISFILNSDNSVFTNTYVEILVYP